MQTNYSFTYGALSFSAPTLEELRNMIASAGDLIALLPEGITQRGPSQAPSVISEPIQTGEPFCDAYCNATGKKRFRMTPEELSLWGTNREGAAKARMDAEGISYSIGGEAKGKKPSEGDDIEFGDALDGLGD